MTNQEIAKEIVGCEKIISSRCSSETMINKAKSRIEFLTSLIQSLEDLCEIDEYVQEKLKNKK